MCNSIDHCYALRHRTSPLPTDLQSLTGSHDTDYYITVVVTNWAYLQTQLTQQITIDTTPPLEGVVYDGDSSGDIDYQQDHSIRAWWTGFFDRESEIQFFQYTFGAGCADQSMFTIPAFHNVCECYSTVIVVIHSLYRLVQQMRLQSPGLLQQRGYIMSLWLPSTQLSVTLNWSALMG